MARRIKLVGPRGKLIRVISPMPEKIDPAEVAKALGKLRSSKAFHSTQPNLRVLTSATSARFLEKCWANEALETLEKEDQGNVNVFLTEEDLADLQKLILHRSVFLSIAVVCAAFVISHFFFLVALESRPAHIADVIFMVLLGAIVGYSANRFWIATKERKALLASIYRRSARVREGAGLLNLFVN